ncbi:MAG: hypothetical protein ACM3L6_06230 [Deltaproteobacteria bacterium]
MADNQALGPVEALKIALNLETEAAEFYRTHAAKESVARETFLFLLNEEEKHHRLIEQKLAEMTRA